MPRNQGKYFNSCECTSGANASNITEQTTEKLHLHSFLRGKAL